jgi:hypothetical protein
LSSQPKAFCRSRDSQGSGAVREGTTKNAPDNRRKSENGGRPGGIFEQASGPVHQTDQQCSEKQRLGNKSFKELIFTSALLLIQLALDTHLQQHFAMDSF